MLSDLLGSWTVEKTDIPDAAKAYWMHFCEDAYCAQETLTDLGWLRAWYYCELLPTGFRFTCLGKYSNSSGEAHTYDAQAVLAPPDLILTHPKGYVSHLRKSDTRPLPPRFNLIPCQKPLPDGTFLRQELPDPLLTLEEVRQLEQKQSSP